MKFKCVVFRLRFLLAILLSPATSALQGQNGNLLKVNSLNSSEYINIQSLIDRQIEYMQKTYSARVEAPKEIINGKEYESYYIRSQSKPLLYINKRRTATIFTRTRRYTNLTLQYDTFLDEVIYTDTSRTLNYRFPQIALNKDIVDGFNLYFEDDSLIFRNLRLPECSKRNLKEGFYEIAYQGQSEYVIKHSSSFYVKEGRNEYKYDAENYLSLGDVFYRVNNRRSLLKVFGDRSTEVKRYLHMSRIRIRQADKNQLVSVMKFYDSLLTSSRGSE